MWGAMWSEVILPLESMDRRAEVTLSVRVRLAQDNRMHARRTASFGVSYKYVSSKKGEDLLAWCETKIAPPAGGPRAPPQCPLHGVRAPRRDQLMEQRISGIGNARRSARVLL